MNNEAIITITPDQDALQIDLGDVAPHTVVDTLMNFRNLMEQDPQLGTLSELHGPAVIRIINLPGLGGLINVNFGDVGRDEFMDSITEIMRTISQQMIENARIVAGTSDQKQVERFFELTQKQNPYLN